MLGNKMKKENFDFQKTRIRLLTVPRLCNGTFEHLVTSKKTCKAAVTKSWVKAPFKASSWV